MDTVLLVDFNNLMFRTLFAKDVFIKSEYPNYSLWRYLIYNSIYESIKTVKATEVVLAVDDKNSWRKAYFKRYKESRKNKREKQEVNWQIVFNLINKYIADVKHHMPFKVLRVRSAEADDIIGVLSLNLDDQCIISSNDEDYLQLCSKENIKVWNPTQRKYMTCSDTEEFLNMLILTGQKKDDIFNVKTPIDWGLTKETEGKKKPGLGEVTAKKILKEGLEEWLERNDLHDNWKRNSVLIDFRKIPVTIQNRVLDMYYNYNFPPPENIMPFFKKYKMKGFVEEYHEVEDILMRLY